MISVRGVAVLALVLLSIVFGACSNSDSSPPLGSAVIGPGGGSLVVGDGEISLTVPAGALSTEVEMHVYQGQHSKVPGYVDVGAPHQFSPTGTEFSTPAEVVIPYDPSRVASSVDEGELRVGFRSTTGQVSGLLPTQVDAETGRVTFQTSGLGTFWVAAPDVVAASSLLPLNDGDTYVFDSGLVLTVSRTENEPNFGSIEIAKVTFTRTGRTTGLYFDGRSSSLVKSGEFDVDFSQERFDSPALLIAERDAIGTTRPVVSTYLGYRPYGSPFVGYTGLVQTTTEIAERVQVSTPAGVFDTVRVPITSRFSETLPQEGEEVMEFWFADGVGPVQISMSEGSSPQRLVEATVGGEPIPGS